MVTIISQKDKKTILAKARTWFEENVIERHVKNIELRANGKKITINPFITAYLGTNDLGRITYTSVARSLLYPIALGASITTTFGTSLQKFLAAELPNAQESVVSGMDIEFDDAITERHVYCQVKAGPRTINAGDVPVIQKAFQDLSNLAKVNGPNLNPITDYCVGVLYGEKDELCQHYQKLGQTINVYSGSDFFLHLTGDPHFYSELISEFSKARKNGKTLYRIIEETIGKLSKSDLVRNFVDSLRK